MTAVLSLLLILIGLPLLAWWVGGRSFWNKARPGAERDVHREIVQRHGLRPAEIPKVEGAATWGRRLEDERLRAAVVDWVGTAQEVMAERRRRNPLPRRLAIGFLFLWLLVVFLRAGHAAFQGRWGEAALQLIWLVLLAAPVVMFPWRQRRAVELNSD